MKKVNNLLGFAKKICYNNLTMSKQKISLVLAILFVLTLSTKAFAAFTLSSNAITGTVASTIDLGAGNALSLQTTNNGNITTGNGTLTIGSVSTLGQAITIIKGGVLGGASGTDNFLNVTGTFPVGGSGQINGFNVNVTSAGSTNSQQNASNFSLLAGYTGAGVTRGAFSNNSATSTGTNGFNGSANYGITGRALGAGTGNNVGGNFSADHSTSLNLGVIGASVFALSSPLNIGTAGTALNATVNVGGFFGLMNTTPTLGTSAALIADNGAVAADIFEARDNGTPVVTIADGGTSTFSAPIIASSALNKGTVTLAAGTGTATVTSGSTCVVSETTDATKTVKGAVSSTTLTITGTGSDVIAYICF
jgi:hypothetical protein